MAEYADRALPEEVRGECEADNGIVMTVCGRCLETNGRASKTESLDSDFKELALSPEILEGSTAHKIASAVLSQEVGFITDGRGVACRDINRIVTGLGKEDKLMSVDRERFKSGERTGLVLPYLAGGLIKPGESQKAGRKEVDDEWGGRGYEGRGSLFGRQR